MTAGTVKYVSKNNKSCGPHGITLIGMDGLHYTYCHGTTQLVPDRKVVPPGTELGLTGAEGDAKGPHLHFEIRTAPFKNKYTDTLCPQELLWRLYEGTQPAPDAQFVHSLPRTGCTHP